MSKYNLLKSNFSSGEISPKSEARLQDPEILEGAVAYLENFIPTHNGAQKRGGTRYVADIDYNGVMIPMIVDKTEAYVIIIQKGGSDATIYRNDGVEMTNITFNTDIQIPTTIDQDDFVYVQSNDVIIVTHTSSLIEPFIITREAADDGDHAFTITRLIGQRITYIHKSLQYPYRDPNTNPDLVMHLSSTAEKPTLTCKNSSGTNVTYFTPDHRGAHILINISGVTHPYTIYWVGTAIAVDSYDSGTETIEKTSHGFTTGDKVYTGLTIGTSVYSSTTELIHRPYFVVKTDNNNFQIALSYDDAIAGVTVDIPFDMQTHYVDGSEQIATCSLHGDPNILPAAATATDNWLLSSWSNYDGWPKSITLFEQRTFWGGTKLHQGRIDASLTGNLFHYMAAKYEQDSSSDSSGIGYFGDVSATDAFYFELAASQTPNIQWLSSGRVLQCGTLSAEYIISGGSSAISAVPGTITIEPQTSYGGSDVQPVTAGNTVLFVSREKKRLRSFKYNDANGSYIAKNLNYLSDDIIMNHGKGSTDSYSIASIKRMAYQLSKDLIWMRTSRDTLVAISYDELEGLMGWSRHSISGTSVSVKCINSIPATTGDSDELWILLYRYVNGSGGYYLEKINSDFDNNDLTPSGASKDGITYFTNRENDFPYFADSCRLLTPSTGTTYVGLSHLEGETVVALGDGDYIGEFTVSGGGIDVGSSYGQVIAGLSYDSKIKTISISGSGDFGTPEGNIQRIDRAFLRVYNSKDGQIGPNFTDLEDLDYASTSGTLASGEMYTGGIRHYFTGTPEEISRICIQHSKPTPFHILSLTARGVNYD